jgi:hypothetical protein
MCLFSQFIYYCSMSWELELLGACQGCSVLHMCTSQPHNCPGRTQGYDFASRSQAAILPFRSTVTLGDASNLQGFIQLPLCLQDS